MRNTHKSQSKKTIEIWKVALYIRLSKEDGHEVSCSIINQQKMLDAFLTRFEDQYDFVDYYIDDGQSGMNSERPSFQRLLNDIYNGFVNCIIVKDLSRLSRNSTECKHYLTEVFPDNNIRFISLDGPALDSYLRPEEVDSMITEFYGMVNEGHVRETSRKIRDSFNRKRIDGEFIGSFVTYGYKRSEEDRHQFAIDEYASQVVKDIFKWYLGGMSKSGIRSRLNELGILNPTAYKNSIGLKYCNAHNKFSSQLWTLKTVSEILQNKMYTGCMVQGKFKIKSFRDKTQLRVDENLWYIVPDTHDAIITKQDFERVQELIAMNVKSYNKTGEVHLFAGFLRCDDCKRAMMRKVSKTQVYYSCRTHGNHKASCTKHTIREDELTLAVISAINSQLAFVENMEQLIKKVSLSSATQKRQKDLTEAIKKKETELKRINYIRDEIYLDWKNEAITREDYFRMRSSLNENVEQLSQELKNLRDEISQILQLGNTEIEIFTTLRKFQKITSLDRTILSALVDSIHVCENKEIKIIFRFYDQQERLLSLIEAQQNISNNEILEPQQNTLISQTENESQEPQENMGKQKIIKKLFI